MPPVASREVLIGVGGDAGERGHRPGVVAAPFFARARRPGLHTTMHVGEEGPVADVAIAVDVLGVERIDHGVLPAGRSGAHRRVAERRIGVTACPTSNVSIGIIGSIADHPLIRMRDAGVLVTVNSDNAEMFGVDVADELCSVRDAFGLTTARDRSILPGVRRRVVARRRPKRLPCAASSQPRWRRCDERGRRAECRPDQLRAGPSNPRRRGKRRTCRCARLAANCGVSQPFLSEVERGMSMPSIATLYRIAEALGVAPAKLLPASGPGDVHVVRADEGRRVPSSERADSAIGRRGVLRRRPGPRGVRVHHRSRRGPRRVVPPRWREGAVPGRRPTGGRVRSTARPSCSAPATASSTPATSPTAGRWKATSPCGCSSPSSAATLGRPPEPPRAGSPAPSRPPNDRRPNCKTCRFCKTARRHDLRR